MARLLLTSIEEHPVKLNSIQIIGRIILNMVTLNSAKESFSRKKLGIAKQRKEGSFRERKIFVRKEHFIIIAIDI